MVPHCRHANRRLIFETAMQTRFIYFLLLLNEIMVFLFCFVFFFYSWKHSHICMGNRINARHIYPLYSVVDGITTALCKKENKQTRNIDRIVIYVAYSETESRPYNWNDEVITIYSLRLTTTMQIFQTNLTTFRALSWNSSWRCYRSDQVSSCSYSGCLTLLNYAGWDSTWYCCLFFFKGHVPFSQKWQNISKQSNCAGSWKRSFFWYTWRLYISAGRAIF